VPFYEMPTSWHSRGLRYVPCGGIWLGISLGPSASAFAATAKRRRSSSGIPTPSNGSTTVIIAGTLPTSAQKATGMSGTSCDVRSYGTTDGLELFSKPGSTKALARAPHVPTNGSCRICGHRFPAPMHRLSAELQVQYRPTFDHVIPRAQGGTDELDNLQLVHFACNRAKGDGSCSKRAPTVPRALREPRDSAFEASGAGLHPLRSVAGGPHMRPMH